MVCNNLERWDGVGDGREVQEGGWFMLRYGRNQHNIVKQYPQTKNRLKINITDQLQIVPRTWLFCGPWWLHKFCLLFGNLEQCTWFCNSRHICVYISIFLGEEIQVYRELGIHLKPHAHDIYSWHLWMAPLVRWTVKCFISSHLYELSTNIIPVLLVRHFFQVQYPRSNRDKLKSHLSRAFLNEHSLYWIYLSSKFTVIINNFLSSNSQGKCHRTAYDQLL